MVDAGRGGLPKKIGKYEIIGRLGKGAMGMVYRALDPAIGREVALKTMMKEAVEGEEAKQRFFREGQAAGRLRHPNIVTIYELGTDKDTPFIAMELLEGDDLRQLLRKKGEAVSVGERLRIVHETLKGLEYAHQRGVVHRDIKPANIHIGTDGAVKIMDFGIARVAASEITKTGMVLGTVSYMSPEQVAGEKVDGRSDIFAVGIILYEMMTGRKPFPGETISTIIHKIISKEPEPFTTENVPAPVGNIIRKALAKNVDQRYQAAGEMAADVAAILAGDASTGSVTGASIAPADPTLTAAPRSPSEPTQSAAPLDSSEPTRTATVETPSSRKGRAPILLVVSLVGCVGLLGVAVLAALILIGSQGEERAGDIAASPTVMAQLPDTPTPTAAAPTPSPTTPSPVEPLPTAEPTKTPEQQLPTPTEPTPTEPETAIPPPSPTPSPAPPPAPTTAPTKTPPPAPHVLTDEDRARGRKLAEQGRDLLYDGKLSSAAKTLETARRLDPGTANAYLYLILTYRKLGSVSKARAVERDARDHVPNWSNNVYVRQLLSN